MHMNNYHCIDLSTRVDTRVYMQLKPLTPAVHVHV